MKKTISVNISGLIFNIEEDAFERLKKYLSTIKGYFDQSESQEEIIGDIEARIAELFSERVSDAKQVITEKDVQDVMDIMGQPEDYLGDEEPQPTAQSNKRQYSEEGRSAGSESKKLFRDPDDTILGGVCSGLGAYFGIDTVWLRLAFAGAVIFFGTGLLLYVILWAVIPEAKTTADKLRMNGDPIDVDSIKKKIDEQFERIKSDDYADNNGVRSFFSKIGHFLETVFKGLRKAFGSVFGFVFLLAGITALSSTSFAFFNPAFLDNTVGVSGGGIMDVFQSLFSSSLHGNMFVFGVILLTVIPLIGLILIGLRLLFKMNIPSKATSIAMVTTWIIAMVMTIFASFNIASDFNLEDEVVSRIDYEMTGDTLTIELDYATFDYYGEFRFGRNRYEQIRFDEDRIYLGNVELDINAGAPGSELRLDLIKSSSGSSYQELDQRVNNIEVTYTLENDRFTISPMYSFPKEDLLRGQHANFELTVPPGMYVHLGEGMHQVIDDMDKAVDESDYRMMEKTWAMSGAGLVYVSEWLKYIGDKDYDKHELKENIKNQLKSDDENDDWN